MVWCDDGCWFLKLRPSFCGLNIIIILNNFFLKGVPYEMKILKFINSPYHYLDNSGIMMHHMS